MLFQLLVVLIHRPALFPMTVNGISILANAKEKDDKIESYIIDTIESYDLGYFCPMPISPIFVQYTNYLFVPGAFEFSLALYCSFSYVVCEVYRKQ